MEKTKDKETVKNESKSEDGPILKEGQVLVFIPKRNRSAEIMFIILAVILALAVTVGFYFFLGNVIGKNPSKISTPLTIENE